MWLNLSFVLLLNHQLNIYHCHPCFNTDNWIRLDWIDLVWCFQAWDGYCIGEHVHVAVICRCCMLQRRCLMLTTCKWKHVSPENGAATSRHPRLRSKRNNQIVSDELSLSMSSFLSQKLDDQIFPTSFIWKRMSLVCETIVDFYACSTFAPT